MSHLASRYRRGELDRQHAAIVAAALLDNPGRTLDDARAGSARAKLPGDPWALRGIPALCQGGVGGAIAGTRPEAIATQPEPEDQNQSYARQGARRKERQRLRHLNLKAHLINRDGGSACYICKQTHPIDDCEVEHIIALCHGGEIGSRLNDSNLALACRDCNRRKYSYVVSCDIESRRILFHQP